MHREEPWYDTAQVCLNGHLITSRAQTSPRLQKKRCPVCGELAITKCPGCGTPIRGHYHGWEVNGVGPTAPPAHCHDCGTPYPWTQRRLQIVEKRMEISKKKGLSSKRNGRS